MVLVMYWSIHYSLRTNNCVSTHSPRNAYTYAQIRICRTGELLITNAAPAKVLAFLLMMENNVYQVHYSTSRDTKESVAGCYCILVQK